MLPQDVDLKNAILNPSYGEAIISLSNHLSYMDRREEALLAVEEAIELYRQLAMDRPAVFNADLAKSLNNLSLHLSNLGH